MTLSGFPLASFPGEEMPMVFKELGLKLMGSKLDCIACGLVFTQH